MLKKLILLIILLIAIVGVIFLYDRSGYHAYKDLVRRHEFITGEPPFFDENVLKNMNFFWGSNKTQSYGGIWAGGGIWIWGREGLRRFFTDENTIFKKNDMCVGDGLDHKMSKFDDLVDGFKNGNYMWVRYQSFGRKKIAREVIFYGESKLFGNINGATICDY